MNNLKIEQTRIFKSNYKKLFPQQKKLVNAAIHAIADNPSIGTAKKGDLSDVFVYKFKMNQEVYLLAYTFDPITLTLIMLGVHENFYRNLKKLPSLH